MDNNKLMDEFKKLRTRIDNIIAEHEPFTLQRFYDWCVDNGACSDGLIYVKGMMHALGEDADAELFWQKCQERSYLDWVLCNAEHEDNRHLSPQIENRDLEDARQYMNWHTEILPAIKDRIAGKGPNDE